MVWGLRNLLPSGLRDRLRQRLLAVSSDDKRHIPPAMEVATRRRLTERYRAQNAELTALTGLDFDDWWQETPGKG